MSGFNVINIQQHKKWLTVLLLSLLVGAVIATLFLLNKAQIGRAHV